MIILSEAKSVSSLRLAVGSSLAISVQIQAYIYFSTIFAFSPPTVFQLFIIMKAGSSYQDCHQCANRQTWQRQLRLHGLQYTYHLKIATSKHLNLNIFKGIQGNVSVSPSRGPLDFQCNHISNSCIFFQYILFSCAFYSNGLIQNSNNVRQISSNTFYVHDTRYLYAMYTMVVGRLLQILYFVQPTQPIAEFIFIIIVLVFGII